MRKLKILSLPLLTLILIVSHLGGEIIRERVFWTDVPLGHFGAFYTKIHSGWEFEEYSRTGDHADIIVDLGKDNAAFVFHRGTSYLPYLQIGKVKWHVNEIIDRNGDGDDIMPDRANVYSVVRIIESTPEQVVVHWRYLPEFSGGNPKIGAARDKFVDEYFTIKPDGSVRRTIRKGTPKLDDWKIPSNVITETFLLTRTGIKDVEISHPDVEVIPVAIAGNPLIATAVADPVAWWSFDEAKGDVASESVGNTQSAISGSKSLWRKGVSGTSLQFDGYFSAIELPADKAPALMDQVTLEGWVTIGAYPWSYAPIVQQSNDLPEMLVEEEKEEAGFGSRPGFDFQMEEEDDTGYFLGIDGYGKPTFKLRVGGKWEQLTADKVLERRTWYHVTSTYDQATGLMKIHVNGKVLAEKQVANPGPIELADKPIKIGQGKERRPVRPVRKFTYSSTYSFDGLLDEVKIYNIALSDDQVKQTYQGYMKNSKAFAEVDMDKRVLPEGEERDEFGAYYTHLKFYDVWDNLWRQGDHPDIVVEFDDSPSKFVFWRGVGYIPMMVNEKGQWFSNEFNETWDRTGGQGCQEPMSDKESYFNHVKIIENTPARTVIQWRYPLIDVQHVMANYKDETGWCDWSEWTYYIYPDGVASKLMHLWTDGERNHEWQESMAIFGPDQHPEQIIHTKDALTMLNLKGDKVVYDWVGGPPDDVLDPPDQAIQMINYTGNFKPVAIGQFLGSNVYNGELTEYGVFPTWNHWPVAQMPSDGRYATYPDRTAHSSLTHLFPANYAEHNYGPKPYYQKVLMEGMLDMEPEELVPLARSWMEAPRMIDLEGASGSYDQAQRAYKLELLDDEMSLTIKASEKRPIYNLAFVVTNWGDHWSDQSPARVKMDGKELVEGPGFRQGTIRDTDGTTTKIIWIEKQSTRPVTIEISL